MSGLFFLLMAIIYLAQLGLVMLFNSLAWCIYALYLHFDCAKGGFRTLPPDNWYWEEREAFLALYVIASVILLPFIIISQASHPFLKLVVFAYPLSFVIIVVCYAFTAIENATLLVKTSNARITEWLQNTSRKWYGFTEDVVVEGGHMVEAKAEIKSATSLDQAGQSRIRNNLESDESKESFIDVLPR